MTRHTTRLLFGLALGAALAAPAALEPARAAPARAAPASAAPAKPAAAKTAPAEGVTMLPGASNHDPINISADKLDYFDKQGKAIYTGNVIVIQGDTRLKASALTIFFDNQKQGDDKPQSAGAPAFGGANSGVSHMDGKGPIVITSKDQVGTGDSLIYDKPTNKFHLVGNVALSQGENVTRGDQLVYDLTSGRAVVTSAKRVRSLIVPSDDQKKDAAPAAQPKKLH